MTLSVQVEDKDLVMDQTAELWRISVLLAKHAHETIKTTVGSEVTTGDFRGTVTAVDRKTVTVRALDGTEQTTPLTARRIPHLLNARRASSHASPALPPPPSSANTSSSFRAASKSSKSTSSRAAHPHRSAATTTRK